MLAEGVPSCRGKIHGLLLHQRVDLQARVPSRIQDDRGVLESRVEQALRIWRDHGRPVQDGAFRTPDHALGEVRVDRDNDGRRRRHALIGRGLPRRVPPIYPHARRLLVFIQVRLKCERFPAPPADVRLRVRMGLDVRPQVRLVRKGLPANSAFEGLLA